MAMEMPEEMIVEGIDGNGDKSGNENGRHGGIAMEKRWKRYGY